MGESEIRRERALEEDGPGCLRRWSNDAKESDTGCCLFECADCFLCDCSEGTTTTAAATTARQHSGVTGSPLAS